MTAMVSLGSLWNSIQAWLFPMLEDELGELDETHREFVAVCELCSPQAYVDFYRWVGNGCPPASRLVLCKAVIGRWLFLNRIKQPKNKNNQIYLNICLINGDCHCSMWFFCDELIRGS